MNICSFSCHVANKYGMEEAILIQNFYFWIETNRANKKNFHDGKYWTYNSHESFSQLFPFLGNKKKIGRTLKSMQEKGIIEVSCFNQSKYDHTNWYTLSDEVINVLENNENTDIPKMGLRETKNVPSLLTDIIPNNIIGQNEKKEDQNEEENTLCLLAKKVLETYNAVSGLKKKPTDNNLSNIKARLRDGASVEDCELVLKHKWIEWGETSMVQYFRPATLFSLSKFDGYLLYATKQEALAVQANNKQSASSSNMVMVDGNLIPKSETFVCNGNTYCKRTHVDLYKQMLREAENIADGN
jgi:uncharacterized phage protein (TIGR02220 family)